MVSYDTTQIALFLSLVLTVAAVGLTLVVGTLAEAAVRNRHNRPARQESRSTYDGRTAFHH